MAKNVLYPDRLTWLVVGDREKIEAGIKELGYGEVQIITVGGE